MHAILTMSASRNHLMNLLALFSLVVQQQARHKGLLHPSQLNDLLHIQLANQLRHLLPTQQTFLAVIRPDFRPKFRFRTLLLLIQHIDLPGSLVSGRPLIQLRNLLLLQHTNTQRALPPSLRQSTQLYLDQAHMLGAVQDL